MTWIRLLPTLFVKYLIKIVYFCCCLLFKVDDQKVTFASYRSNKPTGNLYFVSDKFKQLYPDFHYHFAFKKFRSTTKGKIRYVSHMLKACYHLATSAIFMIDDFYFPVYVINPRKQTTIAQVWHASGALKKFGYSTIGKSFGPSTRYLKHVPIHSNYSMVFVSSSNVVPIYAEAFDMPTEKIYPLGIPRTDILFSNDHYKKTKAKFERLYPNLKHKKLILFAPTYRGKSHYQDEFISPIDFSLMEQHLGDRYALLVHLHPYMKPDKNIFKHVKNFVYPIETEFGIQECLMLADLLITDYSTVFFDYSLLGRPIAFFANDLKDYMTERDFYYSYEKLIPGPLFTETINLINWIQQDSFDIEVIQAFRNRFFDDQDGNASKRIVKHLVDSRYNHSIPLGDDKQVSDQPGSFTH